MNNLTKLETAAKDLINYYCPNYTFKWDKSKTRKGQCRRLLLEIGISRPIAELNTFECMLLTVVHEIAHALTNGGHTKEWKEMCIRLGGDGQATYSPNEVNQPEKQWALYKDGEFTGILRFRRTKLINNTGFQWKPL